MKDKMTKLWIPLYVDKWLFGSTRIELSTEERGVFIDLLVLAAKDSGYIRANENTPYLLTQITGLLNIPAELFLQTIMKCKEFGKIEEPIEGIYHFLNWQNYQFSRQYVHEVETKGIPSKSSSLHICKVNQTTCKPIRKNKIGKDRIEKNIHTSASDKPDAVDMGKSPVNWENCKTDHQRFMAYYVKSEFPTLYVSATQAQASDKFKRYGKAAREILTAAGDLETAKSLFDKAKAFFIKQGLSWNLSTVAKNCDEFANEVLRGNNEPEKRK